ncbi:hypothetical protein AB6735_27710, partial [Mucilaginibacter sp. RCC_168]
PWSNIGGTHCNIAPEYMVNFSGIPTLWQKSGYQQQLKVSRKQLMTGARFRSITTYHKCISHLNNLNYISYQPTYDSYEGSTIQVLP